MGFWNQLRLLLWKNYKLRKHHYVQTITEICWPLTLFLILMFIRLKREATFVTECHYLEKALPSAGFLPVVQTYICTFNNTCFERKHWNDSEIGVTKTSLLSETLRRFSQALDNYHPNEMPSSMNKLEMLDWLNETEPEAAEIIVNFLKAHFRESAIAREYLAENLENLCNDKLFIIMEATVDFPQDVRDARDKICATLKEKQEREKMTIGSVLQFINSSIQQIMEENKHLKDQELAGVIFSRFMCGPYFPSVFEMISREDESLDPAHFQKDIEEKNATVEQEGLKLTLTDEQCQGMFKFSNNKYVNFIAKVLTPFIRGKILYYPKTKITDKLIEKVNNSFALMLDLYKFSELWVTELSPLLIDRPLFRKGNVRKENATKKLKKPAVPLKYPMFSKLFRSLDDTNPQDDFLPVSDYSVLFEILQNLTKGVDLEKKNYYLALTDLALKNIYKYLSCFDFDRFIGVSNQKEMIKMSLNLVKTQKFFASIEFMHPNEYNGDKLPKLVMYKLRTDASRVDSTRSIRDSRLHPYARAEQLYHRKYTLYGFIHLQDLIEHAIIEHQTGKILPIGIWVQHLPYPCHYSDMYISAISASFPLFMGLSWVYTCSMLIKNIVYEKEHRLKEVMKTMGLGNGVHWVGWFLNALGVMLITDVLLTLILSVGLVIRFTHFSLVFVLLFCNSLASIALSFLISTFYFKANLAAAGGGLIFFMTYLPFPLMDNWLTVKDEGFILVGCIFSNVAFGYACAALANWELLATGLHWKELSWQTKYFENLAFLKAISMLLFDSVIYCILTWYIEFVFPGEYGIPRPWYFPLEFCCKFFIQKKKPSDIILPPNEGPNIEPVSTDLSIGIQISRLRKVFSDGKIGLQSLSLNFYEGQITSFLGHNGAGKTTTINILSGLYPPTSGTVLINGLDIEKDLDEIHKSMGVCPQFNVLFEYLTVEEHLWFYSSLKNFKPEKKLRDVDAMIDDLKLPHKRRAKAATLSGGTQRKLSLGCAFIGGSKIIILDEPTAGVDPYARRAIWNLLLKYKKGRTIVMSTHFMDEADILGDRIAIIANGTLCCCGSSLFLKQKFGTGYHLIITKILPPIKEANKNLREQKSVITGIAEKTDESDPQNVKDTRLKFGVASDSRTHVKRSESKEGKITPFIKKYVPDATFVRETRTEISYVLPPGENKGRYVELLEELDKNLGVLEISSYGISDCTLEEIFLAVVENAQTEAYSSKDFSSLPFKRAWIYFKRILFKRKKPSSTLTNPSGIVGSNLRNIESTVTRPSSINVAISQQKRSFSESTFSESRSDEKLTGLFLIFQQYIAILIKRFHHNRRNFKAFFCEIILPCCFITTALLFTLIYPTISKMPPLPIIPWIYKEPNVIFFSDVDNKHMTPVAKGMELALIKDPGIGIRCMKPEPLPNYPCKPVKESPFLKLNQSIPEVYPSCSCEDTVQKCNDSKSLNPPLALTNTTDYLVNMTERNVSKWIITTHKGPTDRRRGGFSLGLKNHLARLNQTNLQLLIEKYLSQQAISEINKMFIKNLAKNFSTGTRGLGVLDNVRVWFYNQAWLSSVTYVNVINNAMLRAYLPKGEDPKEYGIFAINHPVNHTLAQLLEDLILKNTISLLQGICIVFAMSFVPASFVLFYVDERISHFKHLQFVSGVKPSVYWMANFTWDLALYCVSASCCVIIFLIFNERAYASSQNIHGLILLLFCYGIASIPLMYPAAFIFSIPSFAFVALACGNLFIGTVTTTTTFGLRYMGDEDLQQVSKILQSVFLIFPQYCLGQGLMDLTRNQFQTDYNKIFDIDTFVDPLAWELLGGKLFVMILIGAVFFTGVLLWDNYLIWKPTPQVLPKKFSLHKASEQKIIREDDDDDVAQERSFVMSGETGNPALLLENLTKIHLKQTNIFSKFLSRYFSMTSNYTLAVDQLCLALYPGERFGLLGMNGAGKTSTFKMLTGEISVTSGDAKLKGYSVRSKLDHVRQNLGYCPQFDALDNLLTAREHLMFFARIRGIPRNKLKETTRRGIEQLGLEMHADQRAGTYSGGNKRKLSTAIALTGDPPVIFLDEPTTGMDPRARRFLWNCILDTVSQGRLVILTSHSMEECEMLCSRLAIMVNGRFQCLGSIQHLKTRFGSGYVLSLSVDSKTHPLAGVKQFIEKKFPMAVLSDSHYNYLSYEFPTEGWNLSEVFKEMEESAETLGIESYSLQQTTLDQVFVSFAKKQAAADLDISSANISLSSTSVYLETKMEKPN